MQLRLSVLPLVRELVPSSWITCAVAEGSKDSLTVPTMELASTTVCTLMMLVSDVKVSSCIKITIDMMYRVYMHMNPHILTHMHDTHTQEMLLTTVKKERKETQEYKERRETLVLGDHLAHKVWEVVEEESLCRRRGERNEIFLTTMLGLIAVIKSTRRQLGGQRHLRSDEGDGGGGGGCT